jgi:hypothetical protein
MRASGGGRPSNGRTHTGRGNPGEQLYTNAGWQRVGIIPDYALYPYGRPCDTVVFYK